MIEVSVVVNHYRSTESLRLALKYVQQWQREYEFRNGTNTTEVIITDSGSLPETEEMLAIDAPEFVFLKEEKNIGFGRSVNRALERATGEVVFIMNADLIIPRPQELDGLINYIKENEDVGIVAPRLSNFDNTLQYSAFQFYTPLIIFLRRTVLGKFEFGKKRLKAFLLQGQVEKTKKPMSVDWVMGSALVTKVQHLDRVGFFDERYFMYMEDVDLCKRFWKQGLKVVYHPTFKMYHFHGKASKRGNPFSALLNKYLYIHFISAIKYFSKWGVRG